MKKAAVMCILRSGDHALLLCRARPPHVGKYSPIGGKIDPYETPEQTAQREIREEAGVSVAAVRLAGMITETSPVDYNWILYVYTAHVERFTPPPCDEGALAWVDLNRLDQYPTPETDPFIYDWVRRSTFFVLDAVYDSETRLLRMTEEISGQVLYTRRVSE